MMKLRIFMLSGFLAAITLINAASIKVLILSGQTDKYHYWQTKSENFKTILKTYPKFLVEEVILTESNDFNLPTSLDLNKFNVILLNINLVNWSEASKLSFIKYVENGGGLSIIHEADNAFPEWKEYNEMIGLGGWGNRNEKSGPYYYFKDGKYVTDYSAGNGGSHGERVPFVINVRDTKHPITKGLPAKWLHVNDELYGNLRGPAQNIHVLATAFSTKETKGTGKEEPVLFTVKYGKGRIFHSVLGHTTKNLNESFENLGFQITFLRGTEWAATGKVKQKLPKQLLSADEPSIRKIELLKQ